MKPSEVGCAPPGSGAVRSDREAASNQPDLFAERGVVTRQHAPKPMASSAPKPVERLTDDELLERVPNAGPSNVEAVCSELVVRSLPAAVPALEALWRRFAGFGIEKPLREQLAVVDTLARLGGADARAALRRIALSRDLPASLAPAALRAAADAGLALPGAFVGSFFGHQDDKVREAAFALAARSNVVLDRLREGLFDRSATNRRLAAIALGLRGDAKARQPLYNELARFPSAEVIEAITAVWDEDAIVYLGRCARRHPQLAGLVLEALREMENPRAATVARHLESATGGSTPRGE